MQTLDIFNVPTASRWRLCIGLAIVFGGIAVLVNALYVRMTLDDARMGGALLGGLMAALATALGTLPVLLSHQLSQKTYDTLGVWAAETRVVTSNVH
jgi:ZIP family zinc transporter